ncbi:Imm8 family immunity protein [Fibrisoma montanum]|nr:Imm8 family immunity protein [Fibrisoma montanum]
MKAIIKEYYSIDIHDLFGFQPDDPTHFGFNLELILAPDEGPLQNSEDMFNVFICSPSYLPELMKKIYPPSDVIFGKHLIFANHYNFERILSTITNYILSVEGQTWEEVALKINRIARWEFEDYKPFADPK